MSPQPPTDGRFLGWLNAVKGLTFANAAVIVMLVIVAVPTYLVYRTINDEKLLDRFMSHYREYSAQQSPCTVREARAQGGTESWGISTGFAYTGSDRYIVSVVMDHMPNNTDINSYCATLNLIVDFMRDPDAESPSFPDTDEPIIRQYKRVSREGGQSGVQ
jgi:hypothetical protein